jgi:hypothetical protein
MLQGSILSLMREATMDDKKAKQQQNAEQFYQQALQLRDDDPRRAEELLIQAADLGHSDAQYKVGQVFACRPLIGTLCRDIPMMLKYYNLAAEEGHSDARCALASMYENGIGVKQDVVMAVVLYRLSAEQNNKLAQEKLSYLYEKNVLPFYPNRLQDYKADLEQRNIPKAQKYVDRAESYNKLKVEFDGVLHKIKHCLNVGDDYRGEATDLLLSAKERLTQLKKVFVDPTDSRQLSEIAVLVFVNRMSEWIPVLICEDQVTACFNRLRAVMEQFECAPFQEKFILRCAVNTLRNSFEEEDMRRFEKSLANASLPVKPPKQSDARILANNATVVSPIMARQRSESSESIELKPLRGRTQPL